MTAVRIKIDVGQENIEIGVDVAGWRHRSARGRKELVFEAAESPLSN